MAIGNTEAIRDWMEDTWYTSDDIIDVFSTGGQNIYNKEYPYYCDTKNTKINHLYTYPHYTLNSIPCYYGSYNNSGGGSAHLIVSKVPEGVWFVVVISTTWSIYEYYREPQGSIVADNGVVWYYCTSAYGDTRPGYGTNNIGTYANTADAARALIKIAHGNLI